MRLLCSLLFLGLLLPAAVRAQSVGIGTATPASSAVLEVSSTSKGLLLPRLSTAEMNAVANPVLGLLIYNTTANKFYGYGISSTPSTIAQTAQGSGFPATSVGQSFTATGSGNATEITVYLYNAATSTVTDVVALDVYAGSGLGSTPLVSQTRNVSLTTASILAVTFTLPSGGLRLSAGQQYTLNMSFTNSSLRPLGANTDVYAGGYMYVGGGPYTNYDLAFRVNYLPAQWEPLN
jgi:hypothetical protein